MPAPENRFKSALGSGRRLTGCWAALADAYATEVLVTAGFDWILIDGEHAPNDLRSISAQLQVIDGSASSAVVRLPMAEPWLIKQVLDLGAQTLMVPMVESGAAAADLVAAVRYPPTGIRGLGSALARASRFNAVPDYVVTANDQVSLIAQVETRAGLAALDDILAVEGVDCVFIGPADLSADMGHGGDATAPQVRDAIRDALGRIRGAGKAAGSIAFDDATLADYAKWGANVLAVGADLLMLAGTARATAARWKDDG
ncbi:HpcH/HpaI aldolase/citrate lyase family protein [Roseovarius sp. SCSIO 43702]|uniref:HpcH/HpaI aldolase family protein n=1 Tax=Roseovarius sp. SCSIO 43702 TaxID=2823043 RepID=UPI001C73171D|nr:HpcH/HpaI aldolase/citrate lyase family protein [Roseovarius sp. SCSIO 43702]QYX57339.1 HpcH/HpaI aldolase/citrate lyase family protein [Roseovarius sp. SCSIO 43702]